MRWILKQLNHSARTFAIVIRMLPIPVNYWIGLSYLMIRSLDDIEDGEYTDTHRAELLERMMDCFRKEAAPEVVVHLCREHGTPDGDTFTTLPEQVPLLYEMPEGVRSSILYHCHRIATGMNTWAQRNWSIETPEELSSYCYTVAGIPGELMIDLFCMHAPELMPHRERLKPLAVALWEVLQLSNIVRDLSTDITNGVCFVPRAILNELQVEQPADLLHPTNQLKRQAIIQQLVCTANTLLPDAVNLINCIPRRYYGFRLFCSVPLALGIATLRQNRATPTPTATKISKTYMYWLLISTGLGSVSSTWVKQMQFRLR